MTDLWAFFETLKEYVYAADMDSYELLFMNRHLRDALGMASDSEYKGKKCYDVLQGKTAPCSFCSNAELCPGKFYEWRFINPLLGKALLLKDTMIKQDGRRVRVEMAIDPSPDREINQSNYFLSRGDSIVNECLQRTHSTTNPAAAITEMLAFIGEKFQCERVFIFEKTADDAFDNTYEWCAKGVSPQKELLQNEPMETIDWWMQTFEKNQLIVIEDVESIREQHPQAYAALKPQSVHSLIAGPLRSERGIIGFIGVDNPSEDLIQRVAPFLRVIAYFIISILKRRDLVNRLEYLSYHDQLTGALNRNALSETDQEAANCHSLGTVYCDISGLKKINDYMGHAAGDQLIIHCYQLLLEVFSKDRIYRTGGDEFVILCFNQSENDFYDNVARLQKRIEQDEHHIAVGCAWVDTPPIHIHSQITLADESMYHDKRDYYCGRNPLSGESRDRRRPIRPPAALPQQKLQSSFYQYTQNNYFDAEAVFRSISLSDSPYYVFFGDLQSNLFYISDNMRDTFGFQGNIVSDLIGAWEKRIACQEDRELFHNDIAQLMEQHLDRHNLRYRVKDKDGNNFWVHCRSIVEWDSENSIPIFFSGCVSRQEHDFIVDPITNFPKEYAAIMKLSDLKRDERKTSVIGFCLNNFTEINESRGRRVGDDLLRNIALKLNQYFGHKLFFYRLDGIQFMAIVTPALQDQIPSVIAHIREFIETNYRDFNLLVRNPCSFAVLEYPPKEFIPQELLETTMALISLAKNSPDKDYVILSEDSIRKQKQQAHLALEINRAVMNNFHGFRIVVQPLVSANGYKLSSGEALLRWNYNGQDISPMNFIPILEKSKLILPVGKWLFEQVVRTCKRLISYQEDFQLSFNVSYLQVLDDDFLPFMRETLEKYHLDGSHLIMELTETHFDETPEKLEQFVANCKQMGMMIALDDFGNGYSSLALLLKYPANIVKLDRTLLREATQSPDNMKFIKSIVYACHQFGKQVCVEGIETLEEAEIVNKTACDLLQGYYFYRPMELRNLYNLLASPDMADSNVSN